MTLMFRTIWVWAFATGGFGVAALLVVENPAEVIRTFAAYTGLFVGLAASIDLLRGAPLPENGEDSDQ